jgi:HK97 family phage prohead protease
MQTKHFSFEFKDLNDAGTFEGMASVYGNVDSYGDIVMPGAFSKTLAERSSVPILYQHNTKQPIGLGQLADTESGLMMRGELVLDVPEAKSAYALMKKGVLTGLSIGYNVEREKFDKAQNANLLEQVKLMEVSVVTFPANILATVSTVKSANDIETIREFEQFLRDAGFPKDAALTLAAGGWKALGRRDSDAAAATEASLDIASIASLLASRTTQLRRFTWK